MLLLASDPQTVESVFCCNILGRFISDTLNLCHLEASWRLFHNQLSAVNHRLTNSANTVYLFKLYYLYQQASYSSSCQSYYTSRNHRFLWVWTTIFLICAYSPLFYALGVYPNEWSHVKVQISGIEVTPFLHCNTLSLSGKELVIYFCCRLKL